MLVGAIVVREGEDAVVAMETPEFGDGRRILEQRPLVCWHVGIGPQLLPRDAMARARLYVDPVVFPGDDGLVRLE